LQPPRQERSASGQIRLLRLRWPHGWCTPEADDFAAPRKSSASGHTRTRARQHGYSAGAGGSAPRGESISDSRKPRFKAGRGFVRTKHQCAQRRDSLFIRLLHSGILFICHRQRLFELRRKRLGHIPWRRRGDRGGSARFGRWLCDRLADVPAPRGFGPPRRMRQISPAPRPITPTVTINTSSPSGERAGRRCTAS
jgi:hypothetical protein